MNKSNVYYSLETLRDENILPRTNFTRKYPTVNFFQTTVTTYFMLLYGRLANLNVCMRYGFTAKPKSPKNIIRNVSKLS